MRDFFYVRAWSADRKKSTRRAAVNKIRAYRIFLFLFTRIEIKKKDATTRPKETRDVPDTISLLNRETIWQCRLIFMYFPPFQT